MAAADFRLALSALVGLLGWTGCIHAGGDGRTARPEQSRTLPVTVVEAPAPTEAEYVVDDRLYRPRTAQPVKLATAVNATLIGTLAPAAVPSPAGTAIAYNAWRGRRPIIRIRDHPTGADSVLAEGAHSLAWAGDGKLAYFKAVRPDLTDPRRYLGDVVVRSSRAQLPTAWTPRRGRYVVAGWARGSVLTYRLRRGFPDLLVLDGPQRQRVLARGTAFVAVSPDGRHAFVSRYGASPPLVRVLDVPSGTELARLRVPSATAPFVGESGSWAGDRVFAATTTGIVVFRISGGEIAVERVLRTEREFPVGVAEARAVNGGRGVVVWGELGAQPRQAIPRAALVVCDTTTFRCLSAAPVSAASPPRPVYNPSRP